MVKLTVLYNLPPGADHAEFIRWRTTTHQQSNASRPGVIKTDFYVAQKTPLGPPRYRYITESYWDSMDALYDAFFSPAAQAKLSEDVKRIYEPVFLVSEEIVSSASR